MCSTTPHPLVLLRCRGNEYFSRWIEFKEAAEEAATAEKVEGVECGNCPDTPPLSSEEPGSSDPTLLDIVDAVNAKDAQRATSARKRLLRNSNANGPDTTDGMLVRVYVFADKRSLLA